MTPPDKEPISQFAKRIRAKYPQYNNVDDTTLVNQILKKYPQYQGMVAIPASKKKELSTVSSPSSSTVGGSDQEVVVNGMRGWVATPQEQAQIEQGNKAYADSLKGQRPANVAESTKSKDTQQVQIRIAEQQIKKENEQKEYGYAEKAMAEGRTLEDQAAIFRAEQDPEFASQLEKLQSTGQYLDQPIGEILAGVPGQEYKLPASGVLGPSTMGMTMYKYLTNPRVQEMARKNPEIAAQLRQEAGNMLTKYPDFGRMYLSTVISNKMEQMGINNALLNSVTKKELDTVVAKMKEDGELTLAEEEFINREIRPKMGLGNFVRAITGGTAVKTTGAIENALEAGIEGLRSTGQGLAEIVGGPEKMKGERGALSGDLEREAVKVSVKPLGLAHEISTYGGQFLGQALATGGAAKGLQAAKLIKSPAVALGLASGLQAYGNYAPEARKMFPDNKLAQVGYSTIMTGLEIGTERIFNDIKVVDGLLKDVSPSIKKTIQDFTAKNIDAAAAKAQVYNTLKEALQKVPEVVKSGGKAIGQNTIEEVAVDLGGQITEGVFEGKPVEDIIDAGQLAQTARQAFLGSAFIGGLAARADMRNKQGISAKQIYLMARDPEAWAQQIRESLTDPADTNDIEDKLGNLEYAASLLKELDANTSMTEKQKAKFLLKSLDNKIKSEQQTTVTDPVLRAKAEREIRDAIKENDKIKEEILSGKDDGTFEGDKSDEANKDEAKLFSEIEKAAPEGYKATLEAAKSQGNILGGLDYMKDKLAENPIKFKEDFGDEIYNKVLAQTTTENLQEKLDYLIENNTDDPAIPVLDKIISGRNENQTISSKYSKVESDAKSIIEGSMVLDRLSPEQERGRAAGGRTNVEAALVLSNLKKENAGRQPIPSRQEQEVEQYAKDKNIWSENVDEDFGKPDYEGSESSVWVGKKKDENGVERNIVTKAITSHEHGGPSYSLDRIALHNYLFPETKYTVVGFGRSANGEFKIIVEQPFIAGEKYAPSEAIENYMNGLGFKKTGVTGSDYTNGDIDIFDLNEGNVLEDENGNLFFIDPMIETKKKKGNGEVKSIAEANQEPAKPDESAIQPPKEESQPIQNVTAESEGAGQPPISEPPKGGRVFVQRPATELSHKGLQDVANEFSLDDVKTRDRKSDIQLRQDAVNKINEWAEKGEYSSKVEGLVKKAEAGEILTDEQRVILEQHLANVSQELREIPKDSPEFDTKLAEIKRLKDAGEKTRSEAGAALRIPTFRSRPQDLADYYVAEMEAAGVDKLTEKQKETVEQEFDEIKKTEAAYQEKIAALQEENARLRAESEVKKAKGQSKGQKKDYKAERAKIFEDIKEKLKKLRGETQATIVPYAKELVAIAPDVAKLMRSYVDQGVTELADIIKNIHNDLKGNIPQITENDVRDIIAGEYSEKRTQSELAARLRDLRDEAKYINQYEALESGEEPKSESKRIERNQKITELKKKIKDHDLTKLAAIKKRMASEIEKIEEQLKTGDFAKPEREPSVVLDKEGKKLLDRLIEVKKDREIRLAEIEHEKRGLIKKGIDIATAPFREVRSIKAAFDLSAPFRQGLIPTMAEIVTDPKSAVKRFGGMIQSAGQPKIFDRKMFELKNSPGWPLMEESGVAITDPGNITKKEEIFQSRLAQKIPLIGTIGIKGSERAYAYFLNTQRADLFMKGANVLVDKGYTFQKDADKFKKWAEVVNTLTGRGKLIKPLDMAAELLSLGLFSPRLMASRAALFNPMFYAKIPKPLRLMVIKDILKTVAVGTSILALMKFGFGGDDDDDIEVELDPRSPDGGKIKVGNTRLDIWGGYQQYVRLITTLATQKKKRGDRVVPLEDKRGKNLTAPTVGTFLRSKSSPNLSTILDLVIGEDVIGRPTSLKGEAIEYLQPLLWSDVIEALQEGDMKAAGLTAGLGLWGIGVQTYESKK